jgi:hypothetical protein
MGCINAAMMFVINTLIMKILRVQRSQLGMSDLGLSVLPERAGDGL